MKFNDKCKIKSKSRSSRVKALISSACVTATCLSSALTVTAANNSNRTTWTATELVGSSDTFMTGTTDNTKGITGGQYGEFIDAPCAYANELMVSIGFDYRIMDATAETNNEKVMYIDDIYGVISGLRTEDVVDSATLRIPNTVDLGTGLTYVGFDPYAVINSKLATLYGVDKVEYNMSSAQEVLKSTLDIEKVMCELTFKRNMNTNGYEKIIIGDNVKDFHVGKTGETGVSYSKLKRVIVNSTDNETYTAVDGALVDKTTDTLVLYPTGPVSDRLTKDKWTKYSNGALVIDQASTVGAYSMAGGCAWAASCNIIFAENVDIVYGSAINFGEPVPYMTFANKDCEIVGDVVTPPTTIVRGYKGSTAETYAKEWGVKFEAMADGETPYYEEPAVTTTVTTTTPKTTTTTKATTTAKTTTTTKATTVTANGTSVPTVSTSITTASQTTGAKIQTEFFPDDMSTAEIDYVKSAYFIENHCFDGFKDFTVDNKDTIKSEYVGNTIIRGQVFDYGFGMDYAVMPSSDGNSKTLYVKDFYAVVREINNDCDITKLNVPEKISFSEQRMDAIFNVNDILNTELAKDLGVTDIAWDISCVTLPMGDTLPVKKIFVNTQFKNELGTQWCKELNIPASVKRVSVTGDGMIWTSCGTRSINVDTANEVYKSVNGVLVEKATDTIVLYPTLEGVDRLYVTGDGKKAIVINEASNIGAYAVEGLDISADVVIFGTNVKSIDEKAFNKLNISPEKVIVLNPECEIPTMGDLVSDNLTVGCYDWSTAYVYAHANMIPTVSLNNVDICTILSANKYGDVDLDGDIGVADIVHLTKYEVSNTLYPLALLGAANADVCKDDKLDAIDSSKLIEYLLNTVPLEALGTK